MFNLKNKTAIITGASKGIGRAIAISFAKQGADISLNFHSSEKEALEVKNEITKLGSKAILVQADVSQEDQVQAMVKKTIDHFGKIDILVNNAGIVIFKPFDQMTSQDWNKVLDINLKGQFFCIKAVLPHMEKQDKGRIINLASIASGGVGVGFLNLAHYCASKGGVVALTEELALELAPKGININAIAPGAIDTDMSKSIKQNEQALKATIARIPKGRLGKPSEVAAMAVFLASDEAEYCTGAVFYVDGGWLAG
jgi:3-oxoacyl-[acyl-carrier protein] reductase